MTVKEEDLSGRMYAKYGMSKMYKSGYTGWLKPCIFACSIHGDFEGVAKYVFEGKKNCEQCKLKLISKNSSFRSEGLVYDRGIFDLDMNLFDDHKRYKKIKNLWIDMLERCYSGAERCKAYSGCTVDDNWLHCSRFFEDIRGLYNYEKLYEGWHLDKDIIVKGNRVYSKENCCIVPNSINCIFNKAKGLRGKFPIGVTRDKRNNSFIASCHVDKVRVGLGRYKTKEEAFQKYKEYKESIICQKATENRYLLGERVYNAMLKYKVEITD